MTRTYQPAAQRPSDRSTEYVVGPFASSLNCRGMS